TMPNVVRNVRSFWLRRSRRSVRMPVIGSALDLSRGPLHDLVALLEPRYDLDVQPVGEPRLDIDLLRRGLRSISRHLDGRALAAVLEPDETLRDHEDVLLLPD